MATLIRRDIWALEASGPWDPYSFAYAKAVREMQALPDADPRSWSYQAAMHGTYVTPAQTDWNGCQHGSWFFLPWHRMYIYWLERIVKSFVDKAGGPADWSLPYWNYTDDPAHASLPPAFREPTLPDGSVNPLLNTNRRSTMNSGAALTSRTTSTQAAMSNALFSDSVQISFGGVETGPIHFNNGFGGLEDQPHNQVHDAVGGKPTRNCADGWMSDPNCAAQDPIFYLHHSNIDRLWKRWLDLGQSRSNPTNPVWLNQVFPFYDENGGQTTMTPADVLDTVKNLNYAYDDDPVTVAAVAAPRIVPTGGPRRVVKPREVSASTGPMTLGPDGGAATLLAAPETAAAFEALAAGEPPVHIYLHIQDIHVAEHPGVLYELFLNLPEKMSPAEADDHYVGMLNFFGLSHAHHGMGGADASPMEHIYDITDVVRRLSKAGAWDPKEVTVKFIPSSGTDVDPGNDPSMGKPAEVHVGQIRITYD